MTGGDFKKSKLAPYKPGGSVPVHYFPSDPGTAWVGPPPKFRHGWWFSIPIAIVGVLLLVWGSAALFKSPKRGIDGLADRA